MPSCCRFCYSAEEDIDHIFLQCDFAISIWNMLQSTFKFQINRSRDLKDHLISTSKARMSSHVYNLWINGIISTMWIISKLRTGAVFEVKIPNKHGALVLIWNSIREADRINSGTINNYLVDLLILKTFKLQNRVSRAP